MVGDVGSQPYCSQRLITGRNFSPWGGEGCAGLRTGSLGTKHKIPALWCWCPAGGKNWKAAWPQTPDQDSCLSAGCIVRHCSNCGH